MGSKIKKTLINICISIFGFFLILYVIYWGTNRAVEETTQTMLNYAETITTTQQTQSSEELLNLCDFSNEKAYLLSDGVNGVVYFEYTNTSDEITAFSNTYKIKAYQNGIELTIPFYVNDSTYQFKDNQRKNIKKDTTIPIEQAFTLENTTDNIEVDIYYAPNVYPSQDTIIKTFEVEIQQTENT